LITGSSSGIGLDVARAFLDRGSNVIPNARNADKLRAAAEKLGHPERVAEALGSIADRETGEAMVRAAVERFGSVDVLVDHAMAGLPASAVLVSRGGIHALTFSLAAELAADNIWVNAVAPGVVRAPIYGESDVDSFGGPALLGRVGEVNETTEAVLYLTPAKFTIGYILRIDGGYVTGRS
jgi:NAD(P)-dependent dehydrogenase (short-subunit alcohol dehydrogenase family)